MSQETSAAPTTFDPRPWQDEAHVWQHYLRVMSRHGPVTLLPDVAVRIADMLREAEAPGSSAHQVGAGYQAGLKAAVNG